MSQHLKPALYKSVLLSMIFSLLGITVALAASGDLDASFDGDGRVTTDFINKETDITLAIAIQADGKIVAAGYHNTTTGSDFALTRYNTNGSLDTSFGKQLLDFGGNDLAYDVVLQADGKIVLSGAACFSPSSIGGCDLAVARYNTSGTLDTTFSGDGKLTTDFGGNYNVTEGGLVIQSNGKIVVAGYVENGTDADFAVYRYLPNGTLDTTFSGDGRIKISFGTGQKDVAQDLSIQSDGKILVAGYTYPTGSSARSNFAIARLNANGTLDRTFSIDGKQMTDFGGRELAYGLAVQPDGKIVVVGQKVNAASGLSTFAIVRYNPNGNLDSTFGQLLPTGKRSGKRVFSIVGGVDSEARDLVVQSNGKIVVAGSTRDGLDLSQDFALVRLIPNGGFDTTFGQGGKVIVDFGDFDAGYALARQSDGNYVLGGDAFDGTQTDFALARVLK